MRRTMMLVLLGLLLGGVTACSDGPQSLPTVAALPTVTATPVLPTATASPTSTDAPFFTPTSADDPIVFASPTPEALATADDVPVSMGPCSADALTQAIVETGWSDLMTQHTTFVTAFSTSGASLGGWSLANADSAAAMLEQPGTLPMANLRYQRTVETGDQELFVLLSPASGAVGTYVSACLADEAFFRQGDVSADAAITIEVLSLGDAATLAMVTESLSFESSDTGFSELTTHVYSVLVDGVLIQALSIPALDEAMGLVVVARADVLALLEAIIEVMPT